MKNIKSERHHWWPECVSKHWANSQGKTGWIRPTGEAKLVSPKELGVIRDGHLMLVSDEPNKSSPWDKNYESEFQKADNLFPNVIKWLNDLARVDPYRLSLSDRFIPIASKDAQLENLIECIASLVVRSPRNRAISVMLAEEIFGPLKPRKRNMLIGANIHRSQRLIADTVGSNAMFAVLYSGQKEFICGDGFFNNLAGVTSPINQVRILAPVTPNICVAIHRSSTIYKHPKLSTLVLNTREVDQCNQAVQIYSRDSLFYRAQKPELSIEFTKQEFLSYGDSDNPIDELLRSMPGMSHKNRGRL